MTAPSIILQNSKCNLLKEQVIGATTLNSIVKVNDKMCNRNSWTNTCKVFQSCTIFLTYLSWLTKVLAWPSSWVTSQCRWCKEEVVVKDIKVKVRVEWLNKNKLKPHANKGTLTIDQIDKIYNRRPSRRRELLLTSITPLSRFNRSITSQAFWSMVTITRSYSQRTQKLPFHWWMATTITYSQVRCRAQVNIISMDKLKI